MYIKKRLAALATAAAIVLSLIPGVSFAAGMSEKLRSAYDALEIYNPDDVRGNITLPDKGEGGAEILWTSSDESVVSSKEIPNEGYYPTPAGKVTRTGRDENVTLTAEISLDGETAVKTFDLTVKAAPQGEVSILGEGEGNADPSDKYLMYYFKGDGAGQEQIWLAASRDGFHWFTLNDDQPILSSTMGEEGVRDPYIIRSSEGDRYYLIATDLKVSSNGWGTNQTNGSKSIMVWESTDLVDWGEQRMVEISTLPYQGCTWAPEAIYDDTTGQYVVFWASKMTDSSSPQYNMQVVYCATTRDFVTFSEPEPFVTRDSYTEDEYTTVIDTTMIKTENGYYRFTKNESTKRVFMERSDNVRGDYEPVRISTYDSEEGVEGPEIYRLPDDSFCLILDRYGSGGYFPYVTDSLVPEEEGGTVQFTGLDTYTYAFPVSPRHGTVLQVTDKEYNAVIEKWGVQPSAVGNDGDSPIISYNFNSGAGEDGSGTNDATLFGAAKVVYDDEMGSVLSLDGSSDTYLEIPQGSLDGKNELTVSMNVKNTTTGNFFTFALGKDSDRYLFTRLRPDSLRTALSLCTYNHEEGADVSEGISTGDKWTNITFTVSAEDSCVKTYINGQLVSDVKLSVTIADLGKNLLAYVGKSFYSGDSYANMLVDDVEIYDYALSPETIAEEYDIDKIRHERAKEEISRYGVNIDANEKGAEIEDGMFGLFFEDINYAGDGGLYSEVINNRSFEAYSKNQVDADGNPVYKYFDSNNNEVSSYEEGTTRRVQVIDGDPVPIPGYGWSGYGGAELEYLSENPLNENNKTYLRLTANEAGDGVINDCYSFTDHGTSQYSGFSVYSGKKFNASIFARGDYDGAVTVEIIDGDGNAIGSGNFDGITGEFEKYEFTVTAQEYCKNAMVKVSLDKAGTVDLDMISLLPQETYNGRDNGLRADLVEKLAKLRPGFLRFPGGCIVEGYDLSNRYQWKNTVGPVEQRTQNWNRWQTHNEYHDGNGMFGYCQTYGLGFYDYFLLCEDIGAKAVPVLNVGLACQYQSGEVSSWEDLYDIYIPDALDLIEFANGTPDEDWESIDYSAVNTGDESTFGGNWANLRALMGHPESFNMEYIGIGNEQWNTEQNRFFERYEAFEKAIHEVDPSIKLISTSGPSSDGTDFANAWSWLSGHNDDENFTYAVDEHYYKDPDWFYSNVNRYDGYDRNSFGVFAGEYASRWWSGYARGNTWEAALSEAAYMTGLEKNSDVVKMASYAPLFARLGATQWTPDMIWFDSESSFGSADYWVQQLFSRNSGDYNLSTEVKDNKDDRTLSGKGFAGLGTWLTTADFTDYKVVDNETGEVLSDGNWVTDEETEKYTFTVTASASQDTNPVTNINDGDLNTRWSGEGEGADVTCDLGEVKTVGKIGVAALYSSGRAYYYELLISEDGENYKSIFDGTNGYDNGNICYTFAGNEPVRYVKLIGKCNKGTNQNDWNSYTEIEIYGECLQDDAVFTNTGSWNSETDGSASQTDAGVAGAYLFSMDFIDSENYTISVKATKTGGNEGFLIPFMAENSKNFYLWNIAGWNNTQSAFQKCVNGSNGSDSTYVSTVLEQGREYELELVYNHGVVQGFIDGKLVNSMNVYPDDGPVYANSVYDEETGDIILKLINSSDLERQIPVTVNTPTSLSGTATEYLLTSGDILDKNSIDEPEKIAVQKSEIDGVGGEFTYELPAYAVAVLRIHTGGNMAVSEAEEVYVSCGAGEYPALPEAVTVTLSDGSIERRNVRWLLPKAGVMANEGTFKVYGTIEGSEVDAEAVVTVGESKQPIEAASVVRSGEKTQVTFNAPEQGTYKGIFAVYSSDGSLLSAQTVTFTGTTKTVTFTAPETDTELSAKLMLWNAEELAPEAQALDVSVTVD